MKSTILLTTLVILAFNRNMVHRNNRCSHLQDIPEYIQTVAAHEKISAAGSFMPAEDISFVSKAIKGNKEEIMMAQMVLQKSNNPQIKSLAQRLINDCQQLLQELEGLNNNGNRMNSTNNSTTMNNNQAIAYNNLSGNEFDRKWVNDMIIGHTKTIGEFKAEQSRTQNADVKNLITKSLPTISEHSKQLETLRNK
jgi:putative membrane protein